MTYSKEKIIETVPEKYIVIQTKTLKTVLKVFEELKEDLQKVKKMICEQNGKIEDTENFKRIQKGNFGAEKFSK